MHIMHYCCIRTQAKNEKDKECWLNNKERTVKKIITIDFHWIESRKECPCSCINIISLEQTNRKRFRKITDKTLFLFLLLETENPLPSHSASLCPSIRWDAVYVYVRLLVRIHRFGWPFGMSTMPWTVLQLWISAFCR